ncbi:MAG: phage tail protein, partial [Rickettsiales bacterium]|nr:phage tail protein [Rickettsiales bacterium]
APQSTLGYDIDTVKDGWTSGEGYDFYYTDGTRTTTAPLGAAYAWKNIDWWWTNTHTNPDATTTPWVPQSKKIWFTEFGFPSVDGATNQPNVFYDPTSSESYFPYHSTGKIDFRAQRTGIAATLSQWANSSMIEELFLWTWDARPYPYWPDLSDVWADGAVWKTGHWVQGKFGLSSLAAIVLDLCIRAGLSASKVDVTRLQEQVDGFVLTSKASARNMIELLMQAFFFEATERDGVLHFIPKGQGVSLQLSEDDLLPMGEGGERLIITRAQELELPAEVEVIYLNRLKQYQAGTQRSSRQVVDTKEVVTLNLPLALAEGRAEFIAQTMLHQAWTERTRYVFEVDMHYASLQPCDVIEVTSNNITHRVRIANMQIGKPGKLRIEALAEEVAHYEAPEVEVETNENTQATTALAETALELLDIPALPNDAADEARLRIAMAPRSASWGGAVLYRSEDGGQSYAELTRSTASAAMGTTSSTLPDGTTHVFDEVSELYVLMLGNAELHSASELAVLNGANVALVGDEIIQFKTAEEISTGNYKLSGLLRGRLGTEHATASHSSGERFVLLDTAIRGTDMPDGLFGLSRDYKAVSIGSTLGATTAKSFAYSARALKPYAPVHVTGTNESNNDWSIAWVRRTRLGGEWRDYTDVSLAESSEAYEIDILDGSDVVRTISATTSAATYTEAEQITDFGSAQSSLNCMIYQLSDRIGRGYGASGVFS